MHVRGSRWVQAPDCGAPAGPSDFAAGLIRLSLVASRLRGDRPMENARRVGNEVTFLLLIICLAFSVFAHSQPNKVPGVKVTGTYTDMCYNTQGGDVLGMEVGIVVSRDGYFAIFQASEGEPSVPVVVKVIVKNQEVQFTIPEGTIFSGTFTGKIDNTGLRGSIEGYSSGYASKLFLKRQASYWHR